MGKLPTLVYFKNLTLESSPGWASKGLQTPKVEKYLSYIESHLARMDGTLKDYKMEYCLYKES